MNRRRCIQTLREIYAEAERDVRETPSSAMSFETALAIRHHREGVVEGLRRAAFALFGVIGGGAVKGEHEDQEIEDVTEGEAERRGRAGAFEAVAAMLREGALGADVLSFLESPLRRGLADAGPLPLGSAGAAIGESRAVLHFVYKVARAREAWAVLRPRIEGVDARGGADVWAKVRGAIAALDEVLA